MRTRPPRPGSASLGLAPLAPAGWPCPLPARRGGGRRTIPARCLFLCARLCQSLANGEYGPPLGNQWRRAKSSRRASAAP
ncbi:unnamed protein product [Miscanthus lutarioriparius]|uniref:Uncharacterized protein n=1 Tax=Miscanthus lutarioriparius TaxID=422564 RepID=A0A811RBG6_9POAL|nr:unnamed protein product [Miscanthus lutarioriparius]